MVVAKKQKSIATTIIEDFGLLMLSASLFIGGAYILSLKIAFWSLFLGIASVQIGIILIILTFDAFIKRKTKPVTEDYKTLACLVCKTATFVPKYARTSICDSCQVKIATTFKGALVIIFALAGLGTGIVLVGQRQQYVEKAQEHAYLCKPGSWNPGECRCGTWVDGAQSGYQARECSNGQLYFCKADDQLNWKCGKF